MRIVIEYYTREVPPGQRFPRRYEKHFTAPTATECMGKVNRYRENHDLAKYTRAEIIRVEDV